jgi:hypothetical protein
MSVTKLAELFITDPTILAKFIELDPAGFSDIYEL